MNHSCQSTLLEKQNSARREENLVIYLNSGHARNSPHPSQDEQSESEFSHSSAHVISKSLTKTHIIVNGSLVPNTKRCYQCSYKGCEKAYTKPSRLEEHERSHTGHVSFFPILSLAYSRKFLSGRSSVKPVINHTCETHISMLMHGHIYLSP